MTANKFRILTLQFHFLALNLALNHFFPYFSTFFRLFWLDFWALFDTFGVVRDSKYTVGGTLLFKIIKRNLAFYKWFLTVFFWFIFWNLDDFVVRVNYAMRGKIANLILLQKAVCRGWLVACRAKHCNTITWIISLRFKRIIARGNRDYVGFVIIEGHWDIISLNENRFI